MDESVAGAVLIAAQAIPLDQLIQKVPVLVDAGMRVLKAQDMPGRQKREIVTAAVAQVLRIYSGENEQLQLVIDNLPYLIDSLYEIDWKRYTKRIVACCVSLQRGA